MLDKILEVLYDIKELVGQSHWIQGDYSNSCPMLDVNGNQVVIDGLAVYKQGYCLAGLINKRCNGWQDSELSANYYSHGELIGLELPLDVEAPLPIEVGRRVFREIRSHWTWPKTVGRAVESFVEGGRLAESIDMQKVVRDINIEMWNDRIADRGAVLEVLRNAIEEVEDEMHRAETNAR